MVLGRLKSAQIGYLHDSLGWLLLSRKCQTMEFATCEYREGAALLRRGSCIFPSACALPPIFGFVTSIFKTIANASALAMTPAFGTVAEELLRRVAKERWAQRRVKSASASHDSSSDPVLIGQIMFTSSLLCV